MDTKSNKARTDCLIFLKRLRNILKKFSEEFNKQENIDPFPIDDFNPSRLRLVKNKYLDSVELYIIIDLYWINSIKRLSEKRRTYIVDDEFIPIIQLRVRSRDLFHYRNLSSTLLEPYFSQVINSVSIENYYLRRIVGNKHLGFLKDINFSISIDLINSLKSLIHEFYNSPREVFEE